jgi:phospholipid/cholesterol/gamma-HCH transport system substrate-binding protein
MIVELNPGTSAGGRQVKSGYMVPVSNTQPDVNLDEILSVLDSDTRTYLQLLLNGAATGLKGQGGDLAQVWRRFEPTAQDGATLTQELALRQKYIKRAITNFGTFTEALAARDQQLGTFVDSSNQVFQHFANQDANIQQTVQLLPVALSATNDALVKAKAFADQAGPAFQALLPGATALGPSLKATQPFLRDTVPIIKNQLRPFTQVATPVVTQLRPAAADFAAATPNLTTSFGVLNAFLNALSYNPPGSAEGYLFYLAWLNHVTNSVFSAQDALGPIRRGSVVVGCADLSGVNGIKISTAPQYRALDLLAQLTNPPPTVNHFCTPGH